MSVTSKTGPCPICQTSVEVIEDLTEYRRVFSCPICGRLEFYPAVSTFKDFNWNHLSVYLAYNGYPQNEIDFFRKTFRIPIFNIKRSQMNRIAKVGFVRFKLVLFFGAVFF